MQNQDCAVSGVPRSTSAVHRRGAALAESAIVLVFLLGLFLAGFQLGIIGYYQLALDAASHFQARASGLNFPSNSGTGIATAQSLLQTQIPVLDKTSSLAPSLQRPVSIETNGMNFGPNDARTGGFTPTILQPNYTVMTQNSGLLQLGSIKIGINSVAVEGATEEFCVHTCLYPQGVNAAPANYGLNYFGQENAAPYFIVIAAQAECVDTYQTDFTVPENPPWNACIWDATIGPLTRIMGIAARLDQTDIFYTRPGLYLDPSYSGLQNAPPAPGQAGPFFTFWCHRNMFAWIEQLAFPDYGNHSIPGYPATQGMKKQWLSKIFNPLNPATYQPIGPLLPGSIIYNMSPTNSAIGGWDLANNQPDSTSWYGCGLIP